MSMEQFIMPAEELVTDFYGIQHQFEQLDCGCKVLDHQTWVYCNDHLPWKKEPSLIKEELSKNQELKEKTLFGYPLGVNPNQQNASGPIPTVADWAMLHINEPQIIKEENPYGEYTWKIVDAKAKLEHVTPAEHVKSHTSETTSGNVPGTPAPKSVSTAAKNRRGLNGFQKMFRQEV